MGEGVEEDTLKRKIIALNLFYQGRAERPIEVTMQYQG
jgi:hypothetical protein